MTKDSQNKFEKLVINDGEYTTTLTKKYKERKNWAPNDPKKIFSVIPGTIVNIFVKEGQKVKSNKTLVVLEAMKMQNKISVPFNSTIKKIHVKKGEKITKNYLMIEFE